jgi:putative ABC transport system permease protein
VLTLVLTNLRRRKGRTAGTAIGIALGVATIVALLSIGSGVKSAAASLVHLGQADLGIFQEGAADPTASLLPTSLATRLEKRPYVEEAAPLLLIVEGVKEDPAAVVFGAEADGFFRKRLVFTQGRATAGPHEVLVGDKLAGDEHLRPGSTLKVKNQAFRVAGVYHSGIFFEDTGAILDLPAAQRLTHRENEATTIAVALKGDVHHDVAKAAVKRDVPGTIVLGTHDDPVRAGANGELVRKTVSIIAALALIVGGLGVTNTMLMAVLERQRELALLSAVGWPRLRVAALVIAEGIATSVLGAGLGLLLGVIGAGGLNDALDVSGVVKPHVTPWTIGQGLLIGVAIGVLGGLYPAWRGTRGSATDLLSGT